MKKILLFTLCVAFALCIGNLNAQNNAYLRNVSSAEREITMQKVANPNALSISDVAPVIHSAGARSEVIFYEPFEFSIPSTWTNLSADGDAYSWQWEDPNASPVTSPYAVGGCVSSASWQNNVVLYPDNWLISPLIELDGEGTIQYYVAAQDPSYPQDHYGVYVSYSAGTTPADFTLLFEETLYSGTWAERNIPVTGNDIRIAFRHFDCSDWFVMKIDEVKVFFEGVAGDPCPAVTDVTAEVYEANKVKVTWTEPAKALTGYKIYQNDTEKATVDAGVTEWTSDVLNGGTYTFAIAATFDDGCTPVKVPAAPVEIKTCNGKVSNLEVEYDEDCTMATITWDAPGGKNRGNTARGQVSYGGPKYIEFDCENIMSNTTITTTFDCYGGGYLNGNLYSYRNDKDANGNALNCHFQVSNSETGELISTIERTELNGVVVGSVCYDYSSSTMYAVRAGTATTSTLNTVDLETGALTQVATLSGLGAIPLTFAITLEGDMYLIEAASAGNGILYSVALSGACTPIGSGTGYPVNYAQSMAFDYNDPDQTLYWAQIAQPTSGNIVTTWAKVDITTGLATAINTSTGMEISALHFPYEYTPTEYEYNIYRDGLQIGGPTTETIFEDNTFAANEGHVWSVAVSCSNGGDGEWVNLDKESCISIPCSSVTDLEIEFNECASATLTWTAVDGATGYKVVRDGETLTTVTENNYTDEFEIDPAQDYKWEVITVCGAGNEAPAEEITATCVGIKEIERTFSIVPNPATDMITIYSTNNIKTVEVINFLGQTVISQQENKVDVSSLTNGIYFVRVAFENGIGVQKFVKQ